MIEAARLAHARRNYFDLARLDKAPITTEAETTVPKLQCWMMPRQTPAGQTVQSVQTVRTL